MVASMSVIDNRSGGFTLVEIIISITVAGFIALGLTVMVSNLNVISDRASDLVTANSAAEDKFEDLRAGTFLGLSDGTYDFSSELPNSLASPKTATYTVADSSLVNVGSAVKQVDIQIVYNSHGKTQTLRYTGYIGELGVGQY